MCVCVCVCARARVWVHAANLPKVGLEMHHNGLICCGVVNGSSPGHTLHVTHDCTSCRTKDQRVLRTMLLSLDHLLSRGQPDQISMLIIVYSVSHG